MIKGELTFPGDKSISHRALMLAALGRGTSVIRNLSTGSDVQSTVECLKACGIYIKNADAADADGRTVMVRGGSFQNPQTELNCGNSGTSARLLLGLLAGQGLKAAFRGDNSLSQRPMNRVLGPLRRMGLRAESKSGHLPINIHKSSLKGINYSPPAASAQVKSALLLAALGANGKTTISEPVPTRNHTELMLKELGAEIQMEQGKISLLPLEGKLADFEINIPGDPSSAAFFAAAAVMVPGSEIILKNVLTNPTRSGFFIQLEKMGAKIEWLEKWQAGAEWAGNIKIKAGPLKAAQIDKNQIPLLIDELPILAVLATQAQGTTIIKGAGELRLKESDRLQGICSNLARMGADIEELENGFIIQGPTPLRGAAIETFGDHRLAMAFTAAGLICPEPVLLDNSSCVDISYPEFFSELKALMF
ncbi:MAG: 3-phosphoshikimate 1-carboxyvinyltransferase [Candidatus Neomarinimicrobiota bacterium]